jgi:hypothetical protein
MNKYLEYEKFQRGHHMADAKSYNASVFSQDYCLNKNDCKAPETAKLDYTVTRCPGTSNPACRQLNLTGNLPSGQAYDNGNPGGSVYLTLPSIPGAIYQNGAWGKIESCDTSANMGGRVHRRLTSSGDLVFSVEGHNHTCSPSINACVNFLAQGMTP